MNEVMGTPQWAVWLRGAWVQTWGHQQHHHLYWGPWPWGKLGLSEGRCCKATGLSQWCCRSWRLGRNPVQKSILNLPMRLITTTIFVISLGVFHKDTILSSSDIAMLTWSPFWAAKTFKIRGEQDWLYDSGHQLSIYLIKLPLSSHHDIIASSETEYVFACV